MVAVERQATRSGSRCVGQERSLAAWPHENIAPPEATVTLFGVRQGKCILYCPGTSRSQQRQCNHGCGLTCPARYAGDALHRLETVLATDQQGDMRDAQAERSWFLSDSTSPSRQKHLKWLYRPIDTHGVPNYAEGGTRTTFGGFLEGPFRCVYRLLKPDGMIHFVYCCLIIMIEGERFCSQFCSHCLGELSSTVYGCGVREGSSEKGENQS